MEESIGKEVRNAIEVVVAGIAITVYLLINSTGKGKK
jgi:hypothetical protein